MKKKDILLLTLFLTQTASVWAMMEPNEFDYPPQGYTGPHAPHKFRFVGYISHPSLPQAKFQAEPQGEVVTCPLGKLQHLSYEGKLFANTLHPSQPLPQPLGQVYEKAKYTFNYKGLEYSGNVFCPLDLCSHPLTGEWKFLREEKRPGMGQPPRDVYSLLLTFNSQPVQHLEYLSYTDHKEIKNSSVGPDTSYGRSIFDGNTVFREKRKKTYWKSSEQYSEEYYITNIDNTGQVENHSGKVVYVEVLPLANTPPLLQDYTGKYEPVCLLDAEEKKQNIGSKPLIYSDGNDHIYLPCVTQECWHHDNGYDVGFFIASYEEANRISFIPKHIQETKFLEGLYSLSSFQDEPFKRIENWIRLGNNPPHEVKIYLAGPVVSIPGINSKLIHCPSYTSSEPEVEYNQNQHILSIKGSMLTSEHIKKALCNRSNDWLSKINVFGLNKITLSEDITCCSATFSFIAPDIEITNPLSINLRGWTPAPTPTPTPTPASAPPAPASHGAPGGYGGNFFMKASVLYSIHNLTVDVSGGNGGNGQDGGLAPAGQGGIGGFAGMCEVVFGRHANPNRFSSLKIIRENGKPGANGESLGQRLNPGNPAPPALQLPLDTVGLVNLYKDYYFQSAMRPELASYIKLFPNL